MNVRTISILTLLALVTFGSIWFFSRKPAMPLGEPSFESIVIGTNATFPPFAFIENDQIVGFDIDIARELAKKLGKTYTINNMSFEALIPELQMGNIHLIAAGMTPTPERAKRALFLTPHLEADPLMAVQKEGAEPISTKEQLKHKKVVVNQGYSSDQYVGDIDDVELIRVSSPFVSTGLLTLDSGQADVYVAAKSSLKPFLAKDKNNYTITPIEQSGESYAIAISKKYPQLYTSLQTALSELTQDGTIDALKKKWKLDD